jgi:hypothetical protein
MDLCRAVDFRSNLVRLAAIASFYSVHLLHYWSTDGASWLASFLQLSDQSHIHPSIHVALTIVAVIWTAWALLIQRSLTERNVPAWMALITVGLDAFLLTAVLILTAGAQSPLVSGYLLIIMLAGLRLDLKIIHCATFCSMAGYLVVLGCTRWPRGLLLDNPLPIIPRHYQLMIGLAILIAGITAGQWVRHVHWLAAAEARRLVKEATHE